MKRLFRLPYILAVVSILLLVGFLYRSVSRHHKDIPLNGEKKLIVNLDAGFGEVNLASSHSDRLLDLDVDADLPNDLNKYVDYSSRDDVGHLSISTNDVFNERDNDDEDEDNHKHRSHGFHFSGFENNRWDIRLTDAIPIGFDIELGMGKGDFDFTDLTVNDLKLSTGASSVTVRFDKLNKGTIDNMTIESGVSKFRGEGLCNANFRRFKFEGGVGGYTLDFSGGPLKREVDVDIQVGLGSVTVTIPKDVGAKIIYEKSIIAHIDVPSDFSEEQEDTYYSDNYRDARGRMNMRIEAGLGSVKVKRK
jgi:hypothetical protein